MSSELGFIRCYGENGEDGERDENDKRGLATSQEGLAVSVLGFIRRYGGKWQYSLNNSLSVLGVANAALPGSSLI